MVHPGIGVWLLLLATWGGEAGPEKVSAVGLWQQGRAALEQGRTDLAIDCFRHSLERDPGLARNHLSLAAAYLDRGQEDRAATQLGEYVCVQPDHFVVRLQYAELLVRLERPGEARPQFERFIADIQDDDNLARQHLVHCHGRLMEIAEGRQDVYNFHLNRGIGLYLCACQSTDPLTSPGGLTTEGMLCRAAAELILARRRRPDEARPCWYLHEVWSRLGVRQPADRWLRAAEAAAPFSYLTPAEKRALHMACRADPADGLRK